MGRHKRKKKKEDVCKLEEPVDLRISGEIGWLATVQFIQNTDTKPRETQNKLLAVKKGTLQLHFDSQFHGCWRKKSVSLAP